MASSVQPWLVVGLGNPGSTYDQTLHNIGQASIVHLAAEVHSDFRRNRSGLMVADAFLRSPAGQERAYLTYSTTYMNLTGPPVAKFAKKFSIPVNQILVVHDDLDLAAHTLRLKQGGGEGGHNGLRSISAALGSRDYLRLRVGIGRPPGRMDAAAYVLAKIPKANRAEWQTTEAKAAQIVEDVITSGFTSTQQKLHSGS